MKEVMKEEEEEARVRGGGVCLVQLEFQQPVKCINTVDEHVNLQQFREKQGFLSSRPESPPQTTKTASKLHPVCPSCFLFGSSYTWGSVTTSPSSSNSSALSGENR